MAKKEAAGQKASEDPPAHLEGKALALWMLERGLPLGKKEKK